jgi:chorismate synthase
MRFRDESDNATILSGVAIGERAGYTVMTLRQSNDPSNEKFQTHRD